MALFFQKMILAKTHYKTQNNKLLSIIETFKTLKQHLEDDKYKFLMLINYNKLQYYMYIKSLSFKQACQAQKLLRYYFQIYYCQGKANRTNIALL